MSVDVAIPLSNNFDYGDGYDNRSSSNAQINALAFIPGDNFHIFDDIFVSFENDFEGDLDKLSLKLVGGYTVGSGGAAVTNTGPYYYNLVGNFGDLHSNGFLNIYEADGFIDANGDFKYNIGEEVTYNSENGTMIVSNNEVPIAYRLGAPEATASNDGSMAVTIIPGGSNGVNLGNGDDYGMMGVSDMSSYAGHYQGVMDGITLILKQIREG